MPVWDLSRKRLTSAPASAQAMLANPPGDPSADDSGGRHHLSS
jgi:hypothetical protein